jgi:hypothetical protein
MSPCPAPLELAVLLAYWLAELPLNEEAGIEEHLLGCSHCAKRLERLTLLAAGVSEALRHGAVSTVISRPLLEALRTAGLRIREYRVRPGGSVDCTLGARDDGVLSSLEAPLGGVERLDLIELEWCTRHENIPFDPAAGEVLFLPSAAALRRKPAHVLNVMLVAVGAAGETSLGEYRFVHTPS